MVAGALAGYAIAIPVGAIAVLIVETGVRRGFRLAAAAGAGAATADGLYAGLAMIGGSAIAVVLAPWSRLLRLVAVAVLLVIGVRGLQRVIGEARTARASGAPPFGDGDPVAPRPSADRSAVVATYARFVGLTILNPATVIYFAALILALPDLGAGSAPRIAFVVGAFLASMSWQTTLAAAGAVAHHRLPPRFQLAVSALGNVMICGFAIGLARTLAA